jgi:hypothetical protein
VEPTTHFSTAFFLKSRFQAFENYTLFLAVINKELDKRLVGDTKIFSYLNKIVLSGQKSSTPCLDSKKTNLLKKLTCFVNLRSSTVRMVCFMQTNLENCGVKKLNQWSLWMTTLC